jgi:acyl-CoA thioesterase
LEDSRFDRDTALTPVSAGVYAGRFDAGWWAVVGPNGGYVAALHLRALQHAQPDSTRKPRSLHVRYLSAGVEGPIELHVATVRAGRNVSVMASRIVQQGKDVSLASAVFGARGSDVAYDDARLPVLPAPEACAQAPRFIPINHRYEMRPVFGGPLREGERAEVGGYIRLEEPRAVDALLLAAVWDAWMPTPLLRKIDVRFGGAAPTIEASVVFHVPDPVAPPDAFCFTRFESLVARDGYFDETGQVFGPDGTLLAQSRQLALLY